MRRHLILACVVFLDGRLLSVFAGEAATPSPGVTAEVQVPAEARDILNGKSYWRWFSSLRRPIIPVESLKAAGLEATAPKPLVGTEVPPPYRKVDQQDTPAAPVGWDRPEFNDSDWARSGVSGMSGAFGRFSSAALCMRGRFLVTAPAEVKGLYFSLKYYGGVRILLNGKEVARGHLPAGELADNTPAEMYSKDVYVDDKGVVAPFGDFEYAWNRVPADRKKDAGDRKARRTRVLGPVKLPLDAIRKGENILTVELRRTEYPFEALRWFKGEEGMTRPFWIPMNIFGVSLQAEGAGVEANVGRPDGVQVWAENTNDRIIDADYGDKCDRQPVRIVGAKNGTFCGQLVVGSRQPLKGVKVAVGDLKAVQGGGLIPAASITLFYALQDTRLQGIPAWFDGLQAEPPCNSVGVQPVLVRVTVPKDTPAGDYKGEAVATVGGSEAGRLPIELSVADWVVPEPKDYHTYVGVYQSPTSLAMQYKVPEWSEEHWRLMEKSFALLSRVGNRIVNITVVDRTQFGNDDGMIYWVRKQGAQSGGPKGQGLPDAPPLPQDTFSYDFTVFDRYMDLAQKYFALDFVALHVWHSGGWEMRTAAQASTVTVIDEKTGTRSHMQVPKFDTEEAKAFWKPLLDAVQTRLEKRGLDKAMILGILSDGTAPNAVFSMFNSITPGGAKWMRGCHSGTYSETPDKLPGGGVTVLHEFCYGTPLDSAKPLSPYWKQRNWPGTDYERMSYHAIAPLSWYRETGMTAMMRRTRGVGRICLDFLDVLKSKSAGSGGVGSGLTIYNRWPQSSCAQREPSLKSMVWAGPEGAATTLRYEAFCEGIQFAEALLVVSKAIDTKAAILGPEKMAAYRRLLTEMWQREVRCSGTQSPLRPNHAGWQAQIRQLFDAAAVCSATAVGN